MTHWFGDDWGAPCCEPDLHVPVPLGQSCARCKEPILAHDQGVTMPFIGIETTGTSVYHLDCFLKGILPHGPECPRCRGLERGEHDATCLYRTEGGLCSCPAGELAP